MDEMHKHAGAMSGSMDRMLQTMERMQKRMGGAPAKKP